MQNNPIIVSPSSKQVFLILELKEENTLFNISKWRTLKFQSPIKISRGDSINYDQFQSLKFNGFWEENSKAVLTNNGSTGNLNLFW